MQPGRASQTAVLVGMGRAAAHGRTDVARFSDPTAMTLLPEGARERVQRYRTGPKPRGLREGFEHGALEQRANMMVARTVAIDDAIREAAAPQVVILGAGLDGRAWRMPELRDAVVFEVDHPDTQRDKREGVVGRSWRARCASPRSTSSGTTSTRPSPPPATIRAAPRRGSGRAS